MSTWKGSLALKSAVVTLFWVLEYCYASDLDRHLVGESSNSETACLSDWEVVEGVEFEGDKYEWDQFWSSQGQAAFTAEREVRVVGLGVERAGRVYGSPRILADLRDDGVQVSRKTVAKLMRTNGIRGISPRGWVPATTVSDPDAASATGPGRAAVRPG